MCQVPFLSLRAYLRFISCYFVKQDIRNGIGNKGKSTSAPIFSTKAKSKHKEEVKAKRVSKMDSKEIASSVQGKSSC